MKPKAPLIGLALFSAGVGTGLMLHDELPSLESLLHTRTPLAPRTHPDVYRLEPTYTIRDGLRYATIYDPKTQSSVRILDDMHPSTKDMVVHTGKRAVQEVKKIKPQVIVYAAAARSLVKELYE